MYYAVIDIGSNTVKLSIYGVEDGSINLLLTQTETLGLAQYVVNGVMESEGVQRLIETLTLFQFIALKFVERDNFMAFSTAALRGSQNHNQVIEQVRAATGITIDLLSGEEEARLDFIGVTHQKPCGDAIILDIGGGSSELVPVRDGQPGAMSSMPVGCLNLYQKYVRNAFPTEAEYCDILKCVRSKLNATPWTQGYTALQLIGVGGTLRALGKLTHRIMPEETDGVDIPVKTALELIRMLRYHKPGMMDAVQKLSPDRVLTLIPGLVVLEVVVNQLRCEHIVISHYGAREGYLLNRLANR